MRTTCLQSYFLANPLLIFNTKDQSFCCQLSGVTLDLEKGLKIHSLETKLEVIADNQMNLDLDIMDIFTHLGLMSELNMKSFYGLSPGVSLHV